MHTNLIHLVDYATNFMPTGFKIFQTFHQIIYTTKLFIYQFQNSSQTFHQTTSEHSYSTEQ